VAGTEVIEPGLESGDLAHRHVHLGLEEGARRRRGAKEHFAAARVRLLLRHAGGVVENRRELADAELRRGGPWPGERGERVDRLRIDLARQRNGLKVRVDLERKRLDVPLERVAARAHRCGRVGGPVVVLARRQNRYGGRTTPRSVTIAAMSAAGVTSKAGLNTGEALGAVFWPAPRRTSARSA